MNDADEITKYLNEIQSDFPRPELEDGTSKVFVNRWHQILNNFLQNNFEEVFANINVNKLVFITQIEVDITYVTIRAERVDNSNTSNFWPD